MLLKNHFLCSRCHSCFKTNIFYSLDAFHDFKLTFSMFRMPPKIFLLWKSNGNEKTGNEGGQTNSKAGSKARPPQKRIFWSIYSSRSKPQPLPCTGQIRSGPVRSGKVVSIYIYIYIYIYRVGRGSLNEVYWPLLRPYERWSASGTLPTPSPTLKGYPATLRWRTSALQRNVSGM